MSFAALLPPAAAMVLGVQLVSAVFLADVEGKTGGREPSGVPAEGA